MSLLEIMIAMAMVMVLGFMLFPSLAKARNKARQAQCNNNLRQIHQGLMLYDMEHDRDLENFPDRVTHLYKLGYCPNPNVFICAMDTTRATKNSANRTTLKPGNASDDKSDWAERSWFTDPTGIVQLNCSYLYEFSTRVCQTYDTAIDDWHDPFGFAAEFLVDWEWYDVTGMTEPTYPSRLDRNADGVVSWQEAKFWQVKNADVYVAGEGPPGWYGVPSSWISEPYDEGGITTEPMREYPRTWLPVLRCFWHITPERVDDERNEEVLNLALEGNTFHSAPGWEQTAWKYGHNAISDP